MITKISLKKFSKLTKKTHAAQRIAAIKRAYVFNRLQKYNILEKYQHNLREAVGVCGKDEVKGVEDSHHNKAIKTEASYFRHVRNIFAHNPNGTDKPLIQLADEFKRKFETFCSKLTDNVSQFYVPYKDIYNEQVGSRAWTSIRAIHDRVLINTLIAKGVDVSVIYGGGILSFARKIKLNADKTKVMFA